MITLKETTEHYNLGQNKGFKMLIRAMGFLAHLSSHLVHRPCVRLCINNFLKQHLL